MLLTRFPRVSLADVPTPLHELTRLRELIGGPRLFIKRDDNTGLALGGNKARKLEFLLGEALREGADTVITTGGPQSNHARMTVAAARKLGLEPILVLTGDDPGNRRGNLFLDALMGAEIHFAGVDDSDEVLPVMEELADELRAKGKKPYVIPVGGSTPTGALGYVAAMTELTAQLNERGLAVDAIFAAAGSGGTEAGMLVGAQLLRMGATLHAVSVSREATSLRERIIRIATDTAALLGAALTVNEGDLIVYDEYIGPGYGEPTPECLEAVRLLARTEGILMDPVYTGKAFAGMLDQLRKKRFGEDDSVLFYHTGGTPALFALEHFFFPVES